MLYLKIDEDDFFASALATACKENTSTIDIEQTRAELKQEDFGVDNVIEDVMKHW